MKKVVSTLFAFACMTGVHAQYNLFHDVDADGWLWFDSQEKIDKYVGVCDEDDYKVDPNGKPIQLIYADILPDYPAVEADPEFVGVGTDGEFGGPDARTGALIIPAASSGMSTNGGGFVVCMPSCSTFGICVSYDGKALVRMLGTTDVNTSFWDYTVVSAKYASLFKPLLSSTVYKWEDIETLDSGYEPYFNLKSDGPVYAYFQSCTAYPLYVHGIKVTTPTNSTIGASVGNVMKDADLVFDGEDVRTSDKVRMELYRLDGTLSASEYTNCLNLSAYPAGLYVVKAGGATKKVCLR